MEMESSIHSNPSQRNETVHPLAAAKASPSAVHATPPLQRSALASGGSPQTPPRSSSIGIRRAPSTPLLPRVNIGNAGLHQLSERSQSVGRPRSSSSPPPHSFTAPLSTSVGHRTGNRFMPSLREGASRAIAASLQIPHSSSTIPIRRRGVTTSEVSDLRLERLARLSPPNDTTHDHEPSVFELLDVVNPEVATLSTLTNVQNSLFVPDLGRFLNRQPTYDYNWGASDTAERGTPVADPGAASHVTTSREKEDHATDENQPSTQPSRIYSHSISSKLSETNYAVLPHDVSLDGWSEEDKAALNDHVRHMLHSRRSKIKRGLRGFGKYIRKPLGFLVTLYAVLITLFGLAWVFFLIGWIYVGERQPYIIHVIDSVLVALFALNGDVLAPFRARDTYHMVYIAHYHRFTCRLRRERALPKLQDENDLPHNFSRVRDAETAPDDKKETPVLSPKQQGKLKYHQNKFSKSHSFYKPHETLTHRAFPLRLLVAIVVLLDFHSCFQIALGACTWGIDYHVRPEALTPVILCLSLSCNITAGILISVGDRMTRKKEVIERLSRQALTEEAMLKVKPDLAEHNLRNKKEDDPDKETSPRSAAPKYEPYSPKPEDPCLKAKDDRVKSGQKAAL